MKILTWASGILAGVLVVLLAFAGYLWHLSTTLPDLRADPEAFEVAQTSIVYAADGTVLAEWYDTEDRTVVGNDVIPAYLKDAAVAIEDKRFYEHSGVDFQAIVRALSVNTEAGEVRQGGSTITQQTVKLLFTDGERTLTRKIEEALLALQLETRADKDEVLGVYLNTVYFGRGAYGVESASHRFFGSTTADLTLAQSALLAGCIQSPTRYDPFANPAEALDRRNLVLREMRDQGYLTTEEAAAATAEPLGLKEDTAVAAPATFAPYFVEYVRRELLEELGSERLYQGGLRIYTTLDPAAQRAAENAARSAGMLAAEPYGRNDAAAAEMLVIAADSLPDLNHRPNLDGQLLWGRYTINAAFNDDVSVPFAIARLGRHEAVGSEQFTLFRANDPTNPERELRAGEGQVDFRLSRAQATYENAGAVEAATVDGGTLSLDFARRTFATGLALSSPSAGKTELRMAGDVRGDGTFSVRDLDSRQSVAGAVSLDGKEAGYLFERGLGSGLFRGKTLWGR